MKTKMVIKVETVQHGFALEVGNKSWLLESEQELAETVVFRVALGCESDVSKRRMRKLLNMLMYGPQRSIDSVMSHRSHGSHGFHKASRRGTEFRRGRNFTKANDY